MIKYRKGQYGAIICSINRQKTEAKIMLWEKRRYLMSARAEAKNYLRSIKEYKTREEKRAFKLAYKLRIKDMKNKASKLEDHERKLTERAIRSLCIRVGFINIFNR